MRRTNALATLVTAVLALGAGAAQATTIVFSDYQGAESGNSASISQGGYNLDITASPTNFDLTIGRDGLGVECTLGSSWFGGPCMGDDPDQIDVANDESITIAFGESVSVSEIELRQLTRGIFTSDGAEIETASVVITVYQEEYFWETGQEIVDLGGVNTDFITFSAVGSFRSDYSVASITLDSGGLSGPSSGGGPSAATPEPGSALVFALGALTLGRRFRRS